MNTDPLSGTTHPQQEEFDAGWRPVVSGLSGLQAANLARPQRLQGLQGSQLARTAAHAWSDIIGRYEAFTVVSHLPKDVARATLVADGLELGSAPGVPEGRHPVLYAFGVHKGVRPRFFKLWEYDYSEALIGLPHVMLHRSAGTVSGPFYYMTAVRLDNLLANALGVGLGFPKEMADFTITDTTYEFRMTPDGPPVVSARFTAAGDPFDETFPNFATVAPFMKQPVISKTAMPGTFLVTPFSVDTAHAYMFPMEASIDVRDNSLPGLPAGKHDFAGIDSTALCGGYFTAHSWRMAQPALLVR